MHALASKPLDSDSGVTMVPPRPAPTVLVVDDDKDTRELLRYVLERRCYLVSEASDGAEAVILAEIILPDLIIMDTSLRKDGWA